MFLQNNIIILWLQWHFFEAPKDILKAWRNFLLFNFHYFSVTLLLRTFFSHWKKHQSSYGRGFDLKRYFEVFTFNLFSRLMGAVIRSIFLVLELAAEVFIFLIGFLIFIGWLLLPFLVAGALIFSFKMLF